MCLAVKYNVKENRVRAKGRGEFKTVYIISCDVTMISLYCGLNLSSLHHVFRFD